MIVSEWWPVRITSADASSRWVSGICAAAAAASAAVTPGIISTSISSLAQRFNFFSGAAEQQRVSALQADDLQAEQRELNQQRIDLFLSNALFAAAFAHAAKLRGLRNQRENLRPNQLVVQNHVGGLQMPAAPSA